METTNIREASARVIVALTAAGRSRTTIKRHEAEFNAFAGFLEARGHADVSTTEIYARADSEAKRKAIESAYQSLTPEALAD